MRTPSGQRAFRTIALWSNLFDPSLRAIDGAAGFAAIDALRELGVAHIIKGHEIPAKAARRTQREFALYAPRDRVIPVHAFIITRLAAPE